MWPSGAKEGIIPLPTITLDLWNKAVFGYYCHFMLSQGQHNTEMCNNKKNVNFNLVVGLKFGLTLSLTTTTSFSQTDKFMTLLKRLKQKHYKYGKVLGTCQRKVRTVDVSTSHSDSLCRVKISKT